MTQDLRISSSLATHPGASASTLVSAILSPLAPVLMPAEKPEDLAALTPGQRAVALLAQADSDMRDEGVRALLENWAGLTTLIVDAAETVGSPTHAALLRRVLATLPEGALKEWDTLSTALDDVAEAAEPEWRALKRDWAQAGDVDVLCKAYVMAHREEFFTD